jgi:hypothetical protein
MIKIINEIDGKLYEFLPGHICSECAFYNCGCNCTSEQSDFDDCTLCITLDGIWKEVQDVKTKS